MELSVASIFWMQILTSVAIFGLICVWYVWPRLVRLPRTSALVPLVFIHVFRYVGMTYS